MNMVKKTGGSKFVLDFKHVHDLHKSILVTLSRTLMFTVGGKVELQEMILCWEYIVCLTQGDYPTCTAVFSTCNCV